MNFKIIGIKGAKTTMNAMNLYIGKKNIKHLPAYFTCDVILKNIRKRENGK